LCRSCSSCSSYSSCSIQKPSYINFRRESMTAAQKCVLQSSYTPLALPSGYSTVYQNKILQGFGSRFTNDLRTDLRRTRLETVTISRRRCLTATSDHSVLLIARILQPIPPYHIPLLITLPLKPNSITLAGSKLVADRFEAGRRPASNQIA